MSRADLQTYKRKQLEYYSDFLNDFSLNPISGMLARVTNEESVKQSMKNIILTNIGERPFSNLGSKVRASLFEPIDVTSSDLIKSTIRQAIVNHEKRAKIIDIIVDPDEENQGYNIVIEYSIINIPDKTFVFSYFLKRIR